MITTNSKDLLHIDTPKCHTMAYVWCNYSFRWPLKATTAVLFSANLCLSRTLLSVTKKSLKSSTSLQLLWRLFKWFDSQIMPVSKARPLLLMMLDSLMIQKFASRMAPLQLTPIDLITLAAPAMLAAETSILHMCNCVRVCSLSFLGLSWRYEWRNRKSLIDSFSWVNL